MKEISRATLSRLSVARYTKNTLPSTRASGVAILDIKVHGIPCITSYASNGAQMPRGPNGEKRPADVVANAVRATCIATGEGVETRPVLGRRRSGLAGSKARN